MGVGWRDRLPAGTLRARSAICGAVGRASVNAGAANQASPDHANPFHRKEPEPRERNSQKGKRPIIYIKAESPLRWGEPEKTAAVRGIEACTGHRRAAA